MIKMKNKTMLIGIVAMIILVVSFIYFSSAGSSTNSSDTPKTNGEIQKVVISYKNGNYYPNTVTVKSGIPVQITLDDSVKGCFRAFNIPGLGLKKYLKTSSDVLEFTPTKQGTYRFACSMGMGTGTLKVE